MGTLRRAPDRRWIDVRRHHRGASSVFAAASARPSISAIQRCGAPTRVDVRTIEREPQPAVHASGAVPGVLGREFILLYTPPKKRRSNEGGFGHDLGLAQTGIDWPRTPPGVTYPEYMPAPGHRYASRRI